MSSANERLIDSARRGDLKALKVALSDGADIVAVRGMDRSQALHYAANNGHIDCLMHLVEQGGNVRATDNFGNTALHFAAWSGHLPCLIYLAGHNGNINAKNSDGVTVLHAAVDTGRLECIRFLIESGVDMDAVNDDGKTAIDSATQEVVAFIEYLLLSQNIAGDANQLELSF